MFFRLMLIIVLSFTLCNEALFSLLFSLLYLHNVFRSHIKNRLRIFMFDFAQGMNKIKSCFSMITD